MRVETKQFEGLPDDTRVWVTADRDHEGTVFVVRAAEIKTPHGMTASDQVLGVDLLPVVSAHARDLLRDQAEVVFLLDDAEPREASCC